MAPNISTAAGALGSEALELKNLLIRFRCASKYLWAVVADLADWLDNPPPPPPWSAYRSLISCRFITLYKHLGLRLLGIGETLWKDLTKLLLRAAYYQVDVACRNMYICAGLEVVIEGATYVVCRRWKDRDTHRSTVDPKTDIAVGGRVGYGD